MTLSFHGLWSRRESILWNPVPLFIKVYWVGRLLEASNSVPSSQKCFLWCILGIRFAYLAVFSKPGFCVRVCQWSTDGHRSVIDGLQARNVARLSVILRPIHHLQIAFYAHQHHLLHVLNTKPTISEHWTPKWRLKTVKISSIRPTCRQNGSQDQSFHFSASYRCHCQSSLV